MPLHDTEHGAVLPEATHRAVVSTVTPVIPKSLKYLRALLLIMAVLLALNTLGRLSIVWRYGVSPGISPVVGAAVLATVGITFLLACVGAFLLLGVAAKLHWWLIFVLPVLTIANIASAFAIIPSEHVGVGLILDTYLCNGLLTVVLVILLLKRQVRAYFGISRSATRAKAA